MRLLFFFSILAAAAAAQQPPGLPPLNVVAEIDLGGKPAGPALFHEGVLVAILEEGRVKGYDGASGALAWELGFPGEPLLPLAATPEGVLVTSARGSVAIVDPRSGAIAKEIEGLPSLALPPLIGADRLFLATAEGEILAWGPAEGREIWRQETGETIEAIAAAGDLVVVSGGGGFLIALDRRTGEVRWRHRGRGGFVARAVFDEAAERLFIGDTAGDFYCLSAKDGAVRYRWETGAAIRHEALLDQSRVYVVSFANTLFAYKSGNGHLLGRVNLPGRPAGTPLLVMSFLVLTTRDGKIAAVDPASGRLTQLYSAPADILPGASFNPPYAALTLHGGRVLLLSAAPPSEGHLSVALGPHPERGISYFGAHSSFAPVLRSSARCGRRLRGLASFAAARGLRALSEEDSLSSGDDDRTGIPSVSPFLLSLF